MTARRRLLQGATALLYMGPLLAGLAGFGWAMLVPFVSVFVLWLMMIRPHQWPQTYGEWFHARAWLAALTIVLSQILLVAVLFGIGRGIGGVTGALPMFHPLLPVGLSILAYPLSRLAWNAEKEAEKGLTIDALLYPQSRPSTSSVPAQPATPPEEEVRPLLAMPGDAPLDKIGPMLDDALEDDAWARLALLAEALAAAPMQSHYALRQALLIWATEPEHFAANAAPAGLRAAFVAAGEDLPLLARLLPRAAALARMLPGRQAQFPDRAALESLGQLPLPAQVAADHQALMVALGYRGAAKAGRRAAGQASMLAGA